MQLEAKNLVVQNINHSDSMKRSQYNRQTAAFTLIELLAVIAIIGILAAILIPVVGAVRDKARRTQCMSNMRQVGMAILVYESDNGMLPGPSFRRVRRPIPGHENNSEINWTLDSYIGGKSMEVWDCPANRISISPQMNPGNVTFLLNNRFDVTVPPLFFGYPGASGRNGLPKSLNQIEAAGKGPVHGSLTELSQIWMISDVDGENYGANDVGNPDGGSVPLSREASPVHGGGRNYIFFDGHGEFRRAGNWAP